MDYLERYLHFRPTYKTGMPPADNLPEIEDAPEYKEDELAFVVGLDSMGDNQ